MSFVLGLFFHLLLTAFLDYLVLSLHEFLIVILRVLGCIWLCNILSVDTSWVTPTSNCRFSALSYIFLCKEMQYACGFICNNNNTWYCTVMWITEVKLNELCTGHSYFSQYLTSYICFCNTESISELLLTVSPLVNCLSLHCDCNQGRSHLTHHILLKKENRIFFQKYSGELCNVFHT